MKRFLPGDRSGRVKPRHPACRGRPYSTGPFVRRRTEPTPSTDADKAKPKTQRYKIYVDMPIAFAAAPR